MGVVESFEAEQHISHLGLSETSVCWAICGLTRGYSNRALVNAALGPSWAVATGRGIARIGGTGSSL
jgi:hypothetical protein